MLAEQLVDRLSDDVRSRANDRQRGGSDVGNPTVLAGGYGTWTEVGIRQVVLATRDPLVLPLIRQGAQMMARGKSLQPPFAVEEPDEARADRYAGSPVRRLQRPRVGGDRHGRELLPTCRCSRIDGEPCVS